MAKTKITIFRINGKGLVIDSPTSWKIEGTALRVTYVKNGKPASIATTLPCLVEEGESEGFSIGEEVLKTSKVR